MRIERRDSAAGGVPFAFRFRARARLGSAFRLALGLALGLALAAPTAVLAGPGASQRAPTSQPLRFDGLSWEADRAEVSRRLAAAGFMRLPGPDSAGLDWGGSAYGRRARLAVEHGANGRLLAVTLRFEPDARGTPLQRYTELVGRLRRRHGPWAVQVAPGRPASESWRARVGVLRWMGPRSAATLWEAADLAAAAVQLDGDDVVWLRFEAPGWNEEQARRGAGQGR